MPQEISKKYIAALRFNLEAFWVFASYTICFILNSYLAKDLKSSLNFIYLLVEHLHIYNTK